MKELDNYNEVKECDFKGEHYSVRDNGAIFRHAKDEQKPRKLDNQWTFGTKSLTNGYMCFSSHKVHQIVAEAFLGPAEDSQLIIDHIDTNRCNNRPENLRRVTKLENVLNNPITRKRIAYICGSVENFLADPQKYKDAFQNPNFSWMTTVSAEKAAICKENLEKWAKEDSQESKNQGGQLGEWIFEDQSHLNQPPSNITIPDYAREVAIKELEEKDKERENFEELYGLKESLTKGVFQKRWKIPCEFPLCPQTISETPLEDYLKNLKESLLFAKSDLYESFCYKAAINHKRNYLVVITKSPEGLKPFALTLVSVDNGHFVHTSIRTFFQEDGAIKGLTIASGKKWNGGKVLDDYC